MKNINLKIIILFTFALFTLGLQCPDDEFENYYDLELPYKVVPSQKEYKINDTILISALIYNRSLKDVNSMSPIDIKCADIPVWFYIGVRQYDYNLLDSSNVFDIIVDTLNVKDHKVKYNAQFSSFKAYIPQDVIDKEEISLIKIVPKKKGIYMVNPLHFNYVYINTNDDCNAESPTYDLGSMINVFDVADTNPELLNESLLTSNTHISGDRISALTKEGRIFWFKIVD
jgi:hypothetical protein